MQITVTGKHLDISAAMEEYALRKCERLPRFYDRIQKVDVVIDRPGREFEVEIIAHVDRHDPFIGRDRAMDYHACLDSVVDKLSRQLAEYKEMTRNRKHPG
ncbi:MAG: ribosome-associated translation inhibitor RaiA [Phycisphaerales bacterium]|nr:ribosome-associated translation inhibitor RaiA [Phycisphaerales bacterium]